jgi:RNA polymerase sigma-B factor
MHQSAYAVSEKMVALFFEVAHHQVVDLSSERAADLIDRHLPLVRSLARRYLASGEQLDDLVQVGAVGLVAAARRFDPSRGVPFTAYAAATVDGELRRHVRDRVAQIRVPRREQERAASLRRAASSAAQRLGREPSLAETAEAAGLAVEDARTALRGPARVVPLADAAGEASAAAEDEFEACEDRALVRELVASLGPRERRLLGLRFGGDLPQTEIARRLNISQSQASRELAATLEKLRRTALAIAGGGA